MNAAPTPARFVWYELLTHDAAAARAFYSQVIGWKNEDAGMPGFDYTLLTVGDTPVGGLMALPPEAVAAGARPAWIGHIGVPDVDVAAARLLGAGGKVIKPAQDVPEVGRFAVVADPQGAVFDLFQSYTEPGAPLREGTPGVFMWHELCADDPVAAMDFYARQFGWARDEALDMGPAGTYQLFTAGGEAIGGIMARPPEVPCAFWLYYVNVADVTATIACATGLGATLLNGPMEVPGGAWVAQFLDPQGAPFAVVGPLGG